MSNFKLTGRDKIMILILAVILIGVVYYLAFLSPLNDDIAELKLQCDELQTEIDQNAAKVASMDEMQAELDEIFSRPKDEITEIAPYDNKKTVMNFLNGILSRGTEYNLSSPDPEISEDGMVRRNVELSFSSNDYDTAKSILKDLANWNYRCLLKDVVISTASEDGKGSISGGAINISATMTFFESQKIS